jgi:hypothetical protein
VENWLKEMDQIEGHDDISGRESFNIEALLSLSSENNS